MNTGSKDLDEIFQYNNEVIMIYGAPASGKTTFAKLAAIAFALKDKKVIFIDTENGFSLDRFKQLSGENYLKLLENIIILKPKSLFEQSRDVRHLNDSIKAGNVDLVILDSVGKYYRAVLHKGAFMINRAMDKQLVMLKNISKNIPVILTNQVYQGMDNKIKNVGGNMFKRKSDCVIRLEKEPRRWILEKPEEKEMRFEINEKGIIKKL